MITGIELIAIERQEQIKKHNYNANHDGQHDNGELISAAIFAITLDDEWKQKGFGKFEKRMQTKFIKDRLIITGALIAAEIDIMKIKE